jgi:hypothetical protein
MKYTAFVYPVKSISSSFLKTSFWLGDIRDSEWGEKEMHILSSGHRPRDAWYPFTVLSLSSMEEVMGQRILSWY